MPGLKPQLPHLQLCDLRWVACPLCALPPAPSKFLRKCLELGLAHRKLSGHAQAQRRDMFGPRLLLANKGARLEPMSKATFFP